MIRLEKIDKEKTTEDAIAILESWSNPHNLCFSAESAKRVYDILKPVVERETYIRKKMHVLNARLRRNEIIDAYDLVRSMSKVLDDAYYGDSK